MINQRTHVAIKRRAGATLAALLIGAVAALQQGCAGPATPDDAAAFASPAAGANAVVDALRANDLARVKAILGSGSDDIISSGDDVADRDAFRNFVSDYDRKHGFIAEDENTTIITVGETDWPLPIPLVRKGDTWRFDVDQGRDEMLSRRIGRNELSTIEVCRAAIDAQHDYYVMESGKPGGGAYAAKFISDPGTRNGLYWPSSPGQPQSPLGPLVGEAATEGYTGQGQKSGLRPYHGYYYRLLTGQGAAAPGGARSYLSGGRLTGGVAILAYPVTYGNSGIMTFIVNHNGIVYQRDFGEQTPQIASSVTLFDPDANWTVVSEIETLGTQP